MSYRSSLWGRASRPFALSAGLFFAMAAASLPCAADSAAPCPAYTAASGAPALSITQISDCLTRRLASLKEISLHVEGQTRTTARSSPTPLALDAIALLPNVLRFELLKPDSMAGTIQVRDKKADLIETYYPVTDTVVRGKLSQVQGSEGLPFNVSEVLSLPPADSFDLSLIGSQTVDDHVILTVGARRRGDATAPKFTFWIDAEDWIFTKMQEQDADGAILLELAFSRVKLNPGLTIAQVEQMPADASVQSM